MQFHKCTYDEKYTAFISVIKLEGMIMYSFRCRYVDSPLHL